MKMTTLKKKLSFIVCIVLIAAIALFTGGCTDNTQTPDAAEITVENGTTEDISNITEDSNDVKTEINAIGQGATKFTFVVTDVDGNNTTFEVSTDKTTVGEALLENGLIDGEQGAYGLYVKTVNGQTFDYETDGKYWAFYVNGEYGATGVDMTDIVAGATYSFKVE